MKTKLLLLILCFIILLGNAQQKSITQPAIYNSNQKLDSVYVYKQLIIKNNNSLQGRTEKLVIKAYDTDKNPTSVMHYYYPDSQSNIINDSLKVTMQHYNYTDFTTDFRHSLHGNSLNFNGFEAPKFYDLFNVKSVSEEIVNTTSNTWIPIYYEEQLSDLRYPNATNFIKTTYSYNTNFEVVSAYKSESNVELNNLGYFSEVIFYNWDSTNGFIPDYKFVYNNTYNVANKLTESIIKKVDDLSTGIEVNHSKFTISYSSNLFEIIYYNWNEVTNVWDTTNKKDINYNNGDPISVDTYHWDNNVWTLDNSTNYTYNFNTQKYTGYSYTIPVSNESETLSITYNTDDLISYESYVFSDYQGHGDSYEKEYYYSSDTGINSVSDNILNTINIYPNPVKNRIYLNLLEEVNFIIYTIEGKLIIKGKTNNSINLNNINSGIYILKLTRDNNSIYKKFIVK